MDFHTIFSLPNDIHITDAHVRDDAIIVTAISTQIAPCCPLCGTPSTHIHSHYTRSLATQPCSGHKVSLSVVIRKCFCLTHTCPRKIFAERLTSLAEPWARVTRSFHHAVQLLGLATGGRLGQRVLAQLGMSTSRSTILRRIMALPSPSPRSVTQVGIDDFAFRRGQIYGTILVDLTTRQVIDLLPDRTTDSVASWLALHPEIAIISRDRGGDYAAAARQAAPQAIQVADRFHLMQNLVAVVESILARCRTEIRTGAARATGQDDHAHEAVHLPTHWDSLENWRQAPSMAEDQARQHRHAHRRDQYEHVVTLHHQGATNQEIAERVGISRGTIGKWLKVGTCPERQPRAHQYSCFAPFAAYVLNRWESGCHNGMHLYQEIAALGFTGTSRMVYRFLVPLRRSERIRHHPLPPAAPLQDFSAHQAVWLFVRFAPNLTTNDRATLTAICQASQTAADLYELVQAFCLMVHQRTGTQLEEWHTRVAASHLPELQRFARGLKRDEAAVRAGLTLPTNNGIVEGNVHKLKLIKRMMFGRAGFPLLRQRVLHAV